MSTRTPPPPPPPPAATPADALDLCFRLGQVQAALARRFDRGLGVHHGVSLADFVLLTHLDRAPGGRLRRVDLAAAVGLTASGVTRALIPLERIGLVDRERNPRDARVAYASLTDAGRRLVADVHVSAERLAEDVVDEAGWSAGEVADLNGLLDRLGATGLPPAG